MTFQLLPLEETLLQKAELEYVDWLRSEAELTKIEFFGLTYEARRGQGRPPSICRRAWVRMAMVHWKFPEKNAGCELHWGRPGHGGLPRFPYSLGLKGDEPAAKNGRFPEAFMTFTQARPHLPTVKTDSIEEAVKHWRKVRIPDGAW